MYHIILIKYFLPGSGVVWLRVLRELRGKCFILGGGFCVLLLK